MKVVYILLCICMIYYSCLACTKIHEQECIMGIGDFCDKICNHNYSYNEDCITCLNSHGIKNCCSCLYPNAKECNGTINKIEIIK